MKSRIYDNTPIYKHGAIDEAEDHVDRIYALARVGLAATDSNLSLDLLKMDGFIGLFETIAILAREAGAEIETHQNEHGFGVYGPKLP